MSIRLSEYIKQLQQILEDHGDLRVMERCINSWNVPSEWSEGCIGDPLDQLRYLDDISSPDIERYPESSSRRGSSRVCLSDQEEVVVLNGS